MKKILTFSATAFVALALLFGVTVLINIQTVQAANEDTSNSANQASEDTPSPAAYNYVAQPDDTYSQMARKAIQTYGVVNKVNLSQAQIIAAETNLTIAAGSPVLLEGQKVSIDQAEVKTEVEKAQKLNKDQQAAWQVYTVGVNFNTNAVGQAK